MSNESLNDRTERLKAIAELRVLQEDHPSARYLRPLIALLQDYPSPDRAAIPQLNSEDSSIPVAPSTSEDSSRPVTVSQRLNPDTGRYQVRIGGRVIDLPHTTSHVWLELDSPGGDRDNAGDAPAGNDGETERGAKDCGRRPSPAPTAEQPETTQPNHISSQANRISSEQPDALTLTRAEPDWQLVSASYATDTGSGMWHAGEPSEQPDVPETNFGNIPGTRTGSAVQPDVAANPDSLPTPAERGHETAGSGTRQPDDGTEIVALMLQAYHDATGTFPPFGTMKAVYSAIEPYMQPTEREPQQPVELTKYDTVTNAWLLLKRCEGESMDEDWPNVDAAYKILEKLARQPEREAIDLAAGAKELHEHLRQQLFHDWPSWDSLRECTQCMEAARVVADAWSLQWRKS